jgi:hypothetical protein
MRKITRPYRATIGLLEFAAACAFAAVAFRLVLMPLGLVDRTSALILAEGGVGWYFASALLFGLLAGIVGACVAIVYNEIAWWR